MQTWKRLAALLLALTLTLGLLPAALAEETETPTETPETTEATAAPETPAGTEEPAAADAVETGFADLTGTEPYAADVAYVAQQGLMSGVGAGRFDPDGWLTRAMVVTVLHRLAGKPAAAGSSSFVDVPADAYYAAAVSWAASQGLVMGVNSDHFAPNQAITREQLAILAFRYVQWATKKPDDGTNGYLVYPMGYGSTMPTEIAMEMVKSGNSPRYSFMSSDFLSISISSQPAISWAMDERLMQVQEDTGNFLPKAPASRADTAVALARLSGVLGLRPEEFCTVTFLMNDGTNRIYLVRHVKVGETVEKPMDPFGVDAGLSATDFGWWIQGDVRSGTRFDFNAPVTEDVTLNALWRGTNRSPF